jgi:hypothetical protein
MALDVNGLVGSLNSLFSEPYPTTQENAGAWARAIGSYTQNIIPSSVTVSAASSAFEAELNTAFINNDKPVMLLQLEAAFGNFATIVGGGMIGYNAVRPPSFIGLAEIGVAGSHGVAALTFAAKINVWMKTGTATLLVFPFTTQPWS